MREEYALLIIIVFIVIVIICFNFNNNIEGMATTEESATSITAMNNEALQNVSSLYNMANAKMTNLNVTAELGVAGNTNLTSLNVAEALGVVGNTNMANANISNNLTVGGATNLAATNVNGTLTTGSTNINGGLNVGGTNVNGDLNVTGNVVLGGGGVNRGMGNVSYCDGNIAGGGFATHVSLTFPTSLYVQGPGILAARIFITSSKHKKVVLLDDQDKVENEIINYIPKINFYKYKNKMVSYDNGIYYGVIAEQLGEVLPEYINIQNDYIPNIGQVAEISRINNNENMYALKFTNSLESVLSEFDMKKIKGYGANDEEFIFSVENNVDTFTLLCKLENCYSLTDLVENMFIYGSFEKCPSVEKSRIAEMALIGVKNVLHRVNNLELEQKNNIAQLNITKLELDLIDKQDLIKRMSDLELKNKKLEDKLDRVLALLLNK